MNLRSVLMKLSARSQDRAVLREPEVPPSELANTENEYETSSNEEQTPDEK